MAALLCQVKKERISQPSPRLPALTVFLPPLPQEFFPLQEKGAVSDLQHLQKHTLLLALTREASLSSGWHWMQRPTAAHGAENKWQLRAPPYTGHLQLSVPWLLSRTGITTHMRGHSPDQPWPPWVTCIPLSRTGITSHMHGHSQINLGLHGWHALSLTYRALAVGIIPI